MESFTRRIEDESDATEFSAVSSDNGFVSSEELRSDGFSDNVHDDEEALSANSTGSGFSSSKRKALFEGPEILERLNVFEEVEHGGRVSFECQCKAHPLPVYKWFKDDVELVENDRLRIEDSLEKDGTLRLIINNVRKSDEGAYRCKLENQEGVAATTGYLSVTGNTSSPNAVSTPPLLRAITEESNVSQDSDEGATPSSTTLEKILTGEYDVTTLPYSQYLELLKDSSALNHETGLSTNEKNGGSRTPTEDTPRVDDVRNLCTDFNYVSSTVTGDDDVNFIDDRMVTMATNEIDNMDAEEIVNKPKSEVIFGTPLLSDSKTVFVIEGSGEEFSSEEIDSWKNSDDKLEEMDKEEIAALSFDGIRCSDIAKGYEAGMEFESRVNDPSMALDSMGDFGGDGMMDSLDEKKLETVIAGRIGMPSDWEFAHYTAEADEMEEDPDASAPDELPACPHMPIETLRSKYEENEEAEMGVLPLASEFPVSAADSLENMESKDVVLTEGTENKVRDSLFGGKAKEMEDKEKIDERKEEAAIVVNGNFGDSVTRSFLADKSTPPVTERSVKRNDESDAKADHLVAFSDQDQFQSDVKGEITPESKPGVKPGKGGVARWMPEMTSITNVVSSLSTLVDAAIPRAADTPQDHKPDEVPGSNGDSMIESTRGVTGFHFSNLVSDLTPSAAAAAAAISNWIPDVSISSKIPDLSPEDAAASSLGKPVAVEDIVAELNDTEEKEPAMSAIDWCVDWFRYPSIFYVLLVLTMTFVASATQMDPALVVLIVALCSLVGFRLFPVQAVQHE